MAAAGEDCYTVSNMKLVQRLITTYPGGSLSRSAIRT